MWIFLFILIPFLIIYWWLNSKWSYYYLGQCYNSCIERVDIQKFRESPEFSRFDGYIFGNLNTIQKSVRQIISDQINIINDPKNRLNVSASINMYEFDDIHRILMNRTGQKNSWKTTWLRYLGQNTPIIFKYPIIHDLFSNFQPQIMNACISILEPGGEIPPHQGQTRAVVKYHVPIDIPEGDIGIEVAGQKYKWDPINRLLFDDTLLHRVWNNTSNKRIILLLDIYRPLSTTQSFLGNILLKLARYTKDYRNTYDKISSSI
jgi:hypothetical protein